MSSPRLVVAFVGLWALMATLTLWAGEAQPARRPRRRAPLRRQSPVSPTPRYLRTDWTRYMLSYEEERHWSPPNLAAEREVFIAERVRNVLEQVQGAALRGSTWFSLHRVARLIAYDLEGIPLSAGMLRVWDEEHDRENGSRLGTTQWRQLCRHGVVPRNISGGDIVCTSVSAPLPESVTDVPEELRGSAIFGWNVRPQLLHGWSSLRGIPHPSPRYLRMGWSRYCENRAEEHRVAALSDAQRFS